MNMHPPFPPRRRKLPSRTTKVGVYGQLADSCLPGHALSELKLPFEAPGLDFVVWIEGVGRVGIQVKGGRYPADRAA